MDNAKFRELLDESYNWPDYYEFKFIVRSAQKTEVLTNLPGFEITEHPSAKGNFVSVSARKIMKSTQEVLDVYEAMSQIKGIISL